MAFTSFLAASALAGLALAAPATLANVSNTAGLAGGFVVNQGTAFTPLPAPAQLANVYTKYGATTPPALLQAAKNSLAGVAGVVGNLTTATRNSRRATSAGTVVASPLPYDSSYLSAVQIGGKTVNLDFDTGSSDLWVFSNELPAASQSGHNIYTVTPSKKMSGQSWKITYGDGSTANGDVYSDTVAIGGATVTAQAVEAAQTVSASFQANTAQDGLLGLAFSVLNEVTPTRQKTWFDTAIAQGLKALFTVNLKKGAPGSYGFGSIDTTQYTAAPTYTAVDTSKGFWTFSPTGYGVGSTFTTGSFSAIADTGTSLLLLPQAMVTAYYNQVTGAALNSKYGAYTFPCTSTLPNFVVGIGSSSVKYTLPGTYINFAPLNDGTGQCYGGLQSSAAIGVNIFGDIWLKAFFVIFDKSIATRPQIGFATKAT